MTVLAITPVRIPPTPDGGIPDSAQHPDSATDFRECHALLEAHELAKWGDLDRCPTFREDLEYWRGNDYEERRLFHRPAGSGRCGHVLGDPATAGNHGHGGD